MSKVLEVQGLTKRFGGLTAVDHVNMGKKLTFDADGLDGGTELRIAVMGQNHMLQQHTLIF